jgi:gas vesicle protein
MKAMLNFLEGLICGAMVGASLAILLAPSSGDELRNQIQARAQNIQLEVKKAADNRREELEQQLATLRAPRKPGETS